MTGFSVPPPTAQDIRWFELTPVIINTDHYLKCTDFDREGQNQLNKTYFMHIMIIEEMGRLHIIIDDELQQKTLKLAGAKFGGIRGAFTRSVEEALSDWVRKNEKLLSN